MPVTVVKTIGSTGVFSTLALWEAGAPANLTTAEQSAAGSFLTAAFIQGENLSFVGSGATGKFLDTDSTGPGNGTYITYGLVSGNPAASDVVTGATSGATCVLSSSTPLNVGVVWQGQCQNQEFVSGSNLLTIAGSTSSAAAYKELTTVAGASFRDNASIQSNALRYNAANGCGIRNTGIDGVATIITEDNARLSNLQIAGTSAADAIALSCSGIVTIDNIIAEGTYSLTTETAGMVSFTASTSTIRNSLFIGRLSEMDHLVGTGTGSPSFYNCTIAAPDDLSFAPASIFASGASGAVSGRNLALFAGDSASAIKRGSASYSFVDCFSDISGTAGVTQATYADEFEDVASATRDFRLKAGAAQIEAGAFDPINAARDIAGTQRASGSLYDVGCWEYVFPSTSDNAVRLNRGTLSW